MLGRPTSELSLEAVLDVSIQRDDNDGLVVIGETNLPNGTKLSCWLRRQFGSKYSAQASCNVSDRRLLLGPFTDKGSALTQGWYEVNVYSYFNDAWQQPKHVMELVGFDGANLAGRIVRALDPDLDETGYAIDMTFVCPSPPNNSEAPLSAEEVEGSIEILKNTVMDVEGHDNPRSAESVGFIVDRYMKTEGLSSRDGWMATEVAPGLVRVTFSFWNGKKPASAIWNVIPRAQETKYRNLHAKNMSWFPDY